MSWNTSWNFLPNNNQSARYGQDQGSERQSDSQWYNTQQLSDEMTNNSNGPSHTYRAWKQENGVKAYGDRQQTQLTTQQPHLPYNESFQDQPHGSNYSVGFNANRPPGNFNFNSSNSYLQGAYMQPHQEHVTPNEMSGCSRGYVAASIKQAPTMNPDYSQHPQFAPNTSARQRVYTETSKFNIASRNSNINNPHSFPVAAQSEVFDGHAYQNYTSNLGSCRHQPYPTRSQNNAAESARGDLNSMLSCHTNDIQKSNTSAHGLRFPGKPTKLLAKLKSSLRVVTCSTEAVHMWKHTLGEDTALMFELFGTVARLEYDGDMMSFDLKGKSLHIKCVFFSMDLEPPAILEGAVARVIGRMEGEKFQCVSIRPATADERSHAPKLIQICNTSLHRFNVRNEQ